MRVALVGVLLALLAPATHALPTADVPPGLVPHLPIVVDGDDGFADPGSGVVGGSGTAADPYRIAGWLVPHAGTPALRLLNTRAHVSVQDVRTEGFDGLVYAITLLNATNVSLEGVVISHAAGGVAVRDGEIEIARSRFLGVHQPIDVTRAKASVRGTQLHHDDPALAELGGAPSIPGQVYVRQGGDVAMRDVVFDRIGVRFEDGAGPFTLLRGEFEGDGTFVGDGFYGPASAYVCGSRFGGSSTYRIGLMLGGGPVDIRGNDVRGGQEGLNLVGASSAWLERNVFADQSSKAMWLVQRNVTAHENVFLGEVRLTRGGDVRENWWGHPSGPSGLGPGTGAPLTRSSGSNPIPEFQPWLAEEPSLAVDCESSAPEWARLA